MKLAILIVTHNSEETIGSVLSRIQGEPIKKTVFVLDNSSTDQTKEILSNYKDIEVIESSSNLGFCAGNNILLNRAYMLSYTHFLFLNPDAAPIEGALFKLLDEVSDYFALTPKILRGTPSMEPITPRTIDACGMYFISSFRHLDRGSGELDVGQYETPTSVLGGTGAVLLVPRLFVEKVGYKREDGYEFFDERFFAYREDADLALRAVRLGLKYRYIPQAVFTHVRSVTPERRTKLSPIVNALSIRNRVLLLINHYSLLFPIQIHIRTFIRNIVAFGYALLFEPKSRKLLLECVCDLSSHIKRRREIAARTTISTKDYSKIWTH